MTVNTKQDVLQILTEYHERIATFGVARYGLFGSYARNEARRGGDIDILVEFAPYSDNPENSFQLVAYLEQILGRRVDLFTPASFGPILRQRILREIEFIEVKDCATRKKSM